MTPLALNEDVFFCITEGQGIFLDLKQDDYSAIPIPDGAIHADGGGSDADILEAFELHRRDLLHAQLVIESATARDELQAYRSIQRPSSHIFHPDDQRAFGLTDELRGSVNVAPSDVLAFMQASHRASALLKKKHIHEVVRAVRSRKAYACRGADDLGALRRQTAIYRKLRPWYPRGYLCLFDGLALVEFLARRHLFPTWVFGVQAQPFGAHCWVQAGDHLLNESMEYAGQFTPIMAV